MFATSEFTVNKWEIKMYKLNNLNYCHSGAVHCPQVHGGNLTSHLRWAWLAGSGWEWEHTQGLIMTKRNHFQHLQHLLNIIITSYYHYTFTHTVDTSGLHRFTPLCGIIKTVS